MFNINKLIISASIAASAALFMTACGGETSTSDASHTSATAASTAYANGKAVIDGGVFYPVVNGMTSDYAVDTQAESMTFSYGRTPTANELAAWDTDVTHIKLPPEGSGSVEEGEELYEAQCVMCHGDFGSGGGGYPSLSKGSGEELQKTLTNQRFDPDADGPSRFFGSYWPQASTMWWYIHDGMPHPKTKSLSVDETYALTAYMLNINEFSIDGEEVDDEYVLDREKFSKIVMPNVDGFEPEIRGENGIENVRAYFQVASNFGGQKVNPSERCMKDCLEPTAKATYISGTGISDFLPPMSTVRDLPKEEGGFDPKAAYESNCAMCHASYLAPGSSDWAGYTAKGIDKVYANGIAGTEGGMPAKGGSSLSDVEFKTVVDYLVSGK